MQCSSAGGSIRPSRSDTSRVAFAARDFGVSGSVRCHPAFSKLQHEASATLYGRRWQGRCGIIGIIVWCCLLPSGRRDRSGGCVMKRCRDDDDVSRARVAPAEVPSAAA